MAKGRPRLQIVIGKTYSQNLKVIRGVRKGDKFGYECECICGRLCFVMPSSLYYSEVKSCGCKRYEESPVKTHGMSGTSVYRIWSSMKKRCNDPKHKDYADYGGRGIKVCEQWLNSFERFLADVGIPPTAKHTLDRYPDVNGNYEPGNVRWATRQEQARNRRNTIRFEYLGEVLTLKEISEKTGLPYSTLHTRIVQKKMTLEEGLNFTPNLAGRKPRTKKWTRKKCSTTAIS